MSKTSDAELARAARRNARYAAYRELLVSRGIIRIDAPRGELVVIDERRLYALNGAAAWRWFALGMERPNWTVDYIDPNTRGLKSWKPGGPSFA